jgi:hypothetical protein
MKNKKEKTYYCTSGYYSGHQHAQNPHTFFALIRLLLWLPVQTPIIIEKRRMPK